jgi:hypothetical protein
MRCTRNEQAEAKSIIQKFIFGTPGEVDAAPIIIGVSARRNGLMRCFPLPPDEAGSGYSANEPEAGSSRTAF